MADQGAAALAFDWLQRVVVPLNQFQPSDEQLEHLRQHTNRLGGDRDSLGTDQVLNVLS